MGDHDYGSRDGYERNLREYSSTNEHHRSISSSLSREAKDNATCCSNPNEPCCDPFWTLPIQRLFQSQSGYEPVVGPALELELEQRNARNGDGSSISTATTAASASASANSISSSSSSSSISSGGGIAGGARPLAAAPMPTPVKMSNPQHGGADSRSHGASLHAKYDLMEEIGVGSTSTCHRCVRKSDGKDFACKVIDKQEIEEKFQGLLDQFNLEVKILGMLRHPNIIRMEDAYETPECVFMVLEMMQGGELFDYVVEKGTLSEVEASVIVRKITSAVAHMHSMGVIHRDLKPENLLLTTREKDNTAEVKLIDFGLAKIMHEVSARSFLGTKGYLAPEMLQRNAYDKAVDIWALGVIVFVLLCGCLPFDDDSARIATESAARKKFTLRFPPWATDLSASAKDLLHNLLDVNPKSRYTADQALGHPWVSGKSVTPNSYLQSPSLLGERRQKERETRSKLEAVQEEPPVRPRKNSI